METHQDDPTSETATDPWGDVSNELSSLGERLRLIYERVASPDGPTEDEIRSAFATLVGVWDQVAKALSTALDDPETRAQLKRAAGSFAAALGDGISGLGEELDREDDRLV